MSGASASATSRDSASSTATWTNTVLSLSPALMLATSTLRGAALSLIFASTLWASTRSLRLVTERWPGSGSLAIGMLLAATWVSVIDLLLQWQAPGLREALGPYAPLAAGTSLLLTIRGGDTILDTHPSKQVLGAALVLPVFTGVLRELLGTGRLLGDLAAIDPGAGAGWALLPTAPMPLLVLPPGALLLISALIAWPPRRRPPPED